MRGVVKEDLELFNEAEKYLQIAVLGQRMFGLATWSDEHSQEEVLAKFDEAIALTLADESEEATQ